MIQQAIDNIELIATVASTAVALTVAAASWRSWRRAELRRDDVHAWANQAIEALQSVRLICTLGPQPLPAADERARITELRFKTSVLVEQGRLFFRNSGREAGDERRERGYRGKRPEILDQLVVAHQIACAWPTAKAEERARMGIVARDIVQRFVTLMQSEVGRTRTASADTRRRGNGASLVWRMQEIGADRLAAAQSIGPE